MARLEITMTDEIKREIKISALNRGQNANELMIDAYKTLIALERLLEKSKGELSDLSKELNSSKTGMDTADVIQKKMNVLNVRINTLESII